MKINGSGVFLNPIDQEVLGLTHTNHYPFWLIAGHLVHIARASFDEAVEAEFGRFEELREEWDTVEEAFERGDRAFTGSPTVRLARMVMTLESIAREQ